MAKYLVIRLSAIGDVAMTIPVIYSVAKENPEDSFTVLTQEFLTSLFINRPPNVEVIGINIKTSEKSPAGLIRFTRKLLKDGYEGVLDLHDVLRSKIIRTLFRLKGTKVYVLDKARQEKEEVTRRKNKKLRPLRPVIEHYGDVFREAGLNYSPSFVSLFNNQPDPFKEFEQLTGKKDGYRIGIAPFAKHPQKIYPLAEMEKIVDTLSKRDDISIFLFGGGGEEKILLEQWASRFANTTSVVGRYPLDKEIALISKLDLFISMDSANMHFASLVGTRVLSVWGPTHPFTGFYGYNQSIDDAIQLSLECRPCSVFGKKPCYRGDHACMVQLSHQTILEKIETILK